MSIRELQGVERIWATPEFGTSVQFAVKLTDEQLIPRVINNFKKLFYATKLRIVNGDSFQQLLINDDSIPVFKMPNYIQNCRNACQWIFDNHSIDLTKSLCNIASSDNIVVVNTNHSVHDAGYTYKVLQHCLDEKLPKMPVFPLPTFEAYKTEIEEVKRKGEFAEYKEIPSIQNDVENNKFLAPKNTKWSYKHFEIPIEKVRCFDKKCQKPIGLTEFMWTGMGMAIGTAMNNVNKIGATLIVDLRRVICPQKVDWSFGVTPGAPNFVVKTSPSMKVRDVMDIFRSQVDGLRKNNGFVKQLIAQFDQKPSNSKNIVAGLSNAGPMKFKKPIKDFYLKSTDYGYGNDSSFFVFSYSKVAENRNELVAQMRTAPTFISREMEAMLWGSFKYWLTNINPDKTINDAMNEMKKVQSFISEKF